MLPSLGVRESPLSSELDELADCARLLDLGEYRIFQAAYRAWFGHEPSEADLKPGFAGYLRGLRLPPWVRHYCRRVIAEAEAEDRLRRHVDWRALLGGRDVAVVTVLGAVLLTLMSVG